MAIKLLGTMEQKQNKAGNTGAKALLLIFYGTGNAKIDKILLGKKGTRGKFSWEQGNTDPPGRPSDMVIMDVDPIWSLVSK